jgi:sugar phosphate isomerase/epimerase
MPQYAFSTLGVPGVALDAVLDLAVDNGYGGVEWRCADGQPIHPGLTGAERRRIASAFRQRGVTPVGLASYVRVAQPGDDAEVVGALRDRLRLAADLGIAGVRVFPGGGDGERSAADERAVRRLAMVVEDATDAGVRVLLETHDSHRSAAAAAEVVRRVGSPAVAVLWDTQHTHLAGDEPADALRTLLPYLGYVQVKDMAGAEDRTPVALAAGVLPLRESLTALRGAGYDGWLVWEYEAAWHPSARPLPPQLVAGRKWLEDQMSA